MRDEPHSDDATPTRSPYAVPATSESPCFGALPEWQPETAQLPVKIGCTSRANDALVTPGQEQALAEQLWPLGQALPQAPQFAESLAVSTQRPEHAV